MTIGVMVIRTARASDVPAPRPALRRVGHAEPADVIAARLLEWEATPRAEILVAELDGEAAGGVAVCTARVSRVRERPDHRIGAPAFSLDPGYEEEREGQARWPRAL